MAVKSFKMLLLARPVPVYTYTYNRLYVAKAFMYFEMSVVLSLNR